MRKHIDIILPILFLVLCLIWIISLDDTNNKSYLLGLSRGILWTNITNFIASLWFEKLKKK